MTEKHKIPQLCDNCSGWHAAAVSTCSDQYLSKLSRTHVYEFFEELSLQKNKTLVSEVIVEDAF